MQLFQLSTHCHPSVSHDLTPWPPQGNISGSATGCLDGLEPQLSPPCPCLRGWLLGEGSCVGLKKLPAALCYLWAGSSRPVSTAASLILTLPSSSYIRLHASWLMSSWSGWLFPGEDASSALSAADSDGFSPVEAAKLEPTATHFKAS